MVEYSLNYLRNRYANIDHRSPKTPGPNDALFFLSHGDQSNRNIRCHLINALGFVPSAFKIG